MRRFNLKILLLFAIIFTLSSCGSVRIPNTYKLKNLENENRSKVGTLIHRGQDNTSFRIWRIDGKVAPHDPDEIRRNWLAADKFPWGNMATFSFVIELLPGRHTITAKYDETVDRGVIGTYRYWLDNLQYSFDVEPGKFYITKFSNVNNTIKVWVEETNEIPPDYTQKKAALYYE